MAFWATLAVAIGVVTLVVAQNDGGDMVTHSPSNGYLECMELFPNIKVFETVPGLGWDNLRNVEASQVVDHTFNRCHLTNGAQYLIPDLVFTVPLKTSRVETVAQLIDQWQNTSSLTSRTINVNSKLSYRGATISGSFSKETRDLRTKQIENKAVTARVMLQYNRYEVKLQPHFPLSPQFRSSVLSLAARIQLNQTEMANYEAQLIVRDFGTHVLTSVTAGAALVKDDYLRESYVASHSGQRTEILTSASASYFNIFKLDTSIRRITETTIDTSYRNNLMDSTILAFGGPIVNFRAQEMTVDQWSSGVDANPVPMDRAGDPLYFLITQQRFPELPLSTVFETAQYIRRAIKMYYDMNLVAGCTRQGAPQFNAYANFEDNSCTERPTNSTFGGVYQTCSVSGSYLNTNPCSGMAHVNPKTGTNSCPPSYTPVNIFQGSKLGRQESRRKCRRCGFLRLSRCCDNENFQARAHYQTYWCAATGQVEPESGYRFGGIFTSTSINLVTGTKDCPQHFRVMRLLVDLSVCVSDDFELSTRFSVPFGGFFSCQQGNPLAVPAGSQSWPSRCPTGFSQHLATVTMGCAFHFCAESGALTGPNLPPVKRPPFMLKPAVPMSNSEGFVMFNTDTQRWMRGQEALNMLNEIDQQPGDEPTAGEQRNAGSGICPALGTVVFMLFSLWSVCWPLPPVIYV